MSMNPLVSIFNPSGSRPSILHSLAMYQIASVEERQANGHMESGTRKDRMRINCAVAVVVSHRLPPTTPHNPPLWPPPPPPPSSSPPSPSPPQPSPPQPSPPEPSPPEPSLPAPAPAPASSWASAYTSKFLALAIPNWDLCAWRHRYCCLVSGSVT